MLRKINLNNINVPDGYKVEIFAQNLSSPTNMVITDNNDFIVGDSGISDGIGKVLIMKNNKFEIVASGFNAPLTGVNFYDNNIYVSHKGFITIIKPDGSMVDIISGLPSWGDHYNNLPIFGPDKKMYFGQGTATNSGVVGKDNEDWVKNYPFFHDYPGEDIILKDTTFETNNFLIPEDKNSAFTSSYSPYNTKLDSNTKIKGVKIPNGSILRSNPDGSNIELVAWGLRNPVRLKFDSKGRLFCTNHGMKVRGSRPIDNCPDEFQLIMSGVWYGWPDFSCGLPITLPFFRPKGMPAPMFLFEKHPMIPPKPFAHFPNSASIIGFDFYNDNAYIAQYGASSVCKLNMTTNNISSFAINKSDISKTKVKDGGLEKPIDIIFDKEGGMYIVDFGVYKSSITREYINKSGVIWKVSPV